MYKIVHVTSHIPILQYQGNVWKVTLKDLKKLNDTKL